MSQGNGVLVGHFEHPGKFGVFTGQDQRGVNALFFRITLPSGQKVFVMGFKKGRCVAVKSLGMGIVSKTGFDFPMSHG